MLEFLSLGGLNWLAVALSLVWALLQGFVWYAFLFRGPWNRANGRAPDAPMVPPGPIAFLTVVLAAVYVLVAALIAKAVLPLASGSGAVNGLALGIMLAVGLVFPPLAGYTIWERRAAAWFGVAAGEGLVKLAGIGLILGIVI